MIIMTPQEKAQSLFKMYYAENPLECSKEEEAIEKERGILGAKACANEVLMALNEPVLPKLWKYWIDVVKELEQI